jgi:hypothetical protein
MLCNKIKYSKCLYTIKKKYVCNHIGRRHYSSVTSHRIKNSNNNGDDDNNKTELLCIWIPVIYYLYYKCSGGGSGRIPIAIQ